MITEKSHNFCSDSSKYGEDWVKCVPTDEEHAKKIQNGGQVLASKWAWPESVESASSEEHAVQKRVVTDHMVALLVSVLICYLLIKY